MCNIHYTIKELNLSHVTLLLTRMDFLLMLCLITDKSEKMHYMPLRFIFHLEISYSLTL